jgi:D-tyrosyl-tRNA(Tyr) deacylase
VYQEFVRTMQEVLGPGRVHTGEFRTMMEVTIVNDGPVTILIDSPTHNRSES